MLLRLLSRRCWREGGTRQRGQTSRNVEEIDQFLSERIGIESLNLPCSSNSSLCIGNSFIPGLCTPKLEFSRHRRNCPASLRITLRRNSFTTPRFDKHTPRSDHVGGEVWQRIRLWYSLYQTSIRSFKTVTTPFPYRDHPHVIRLHTISPRSPL